MWLGGSFVTDDPDPDDIDACWRVEVGVDYAAIDPVLLNLDESWRMREAYGVDLAPDASGWTLSHLMRTRGDEEAGVIRIDLTQETLPDLE